MGHARNLSTAEKWLLIWKITRSFSSLLPLWQFVQYEWSIVNLHSRVEKGICGFLRSFFRHAFRWSIIYSGKVGVFEVKSSMGFPLADESKSVRPKTCALSATGPISVGGSRLGDKPNSRSYGTAHSTVTWWIRNCIRLFRGSWECGKVSQSKDQSKVFVRVGEGETVKSGDESEEGTKLSVVIKLRSWFWEDSTVGWMECSKNSFKLVYDSFGRAHVSSKPQDCCLDLTA